MDLGLSGRKAVVCGGSSGIGYGCAAALAAEGVQVWLVARDAERLDAAVRRIEGAGGRAQAVPADLSDPEAAGRILAATGPADILLTNPGVSPAGDPGDAALWGPGVEVIVAQTMRLVAEYLPRMREAGYGRLIHVTSSGVLEAGAALGLSGALRAALTHASASLARAVGPDGVTVNCIAPGPVRTEGLEHFFARRAGETGKSVDEMRAERLSSVPMRRFAEPEEIGALCALLASPLGASITGRTHLVDCGANAYPFL